MTPIDYLYLKLGNFKYDVESDSSHSLYGAIDWNRDGIYASQPVAAYIGTKYSGSCGRFKERLLFGYEEMAIHNQIIQGGTTLVEFQGTLYALSFSVGGNLIWIYKYAYNGSNWSWVSVSGVPSLSTHITFPSDTPAVTAASINGQNRLYIVFRRLSDKKLFSFFMYMDGSGAEKFCSASMTYCLTSPFAFHDLTDTASRSPSFQRNSTSEVHLYYGDSSVGSLYVYKKTLSNSGSWSSFSAVKDSGNNPIRGDSSPKVIKLQNNEEFLFIVNNLELDIYQMTMSGWVKKNSGQRELFESNVFLTPDSQENIDVLYDNRSNRRQGFHLWFRAGTEYFRFVSGPYDNSNASKPFTFDMRNEIVDENCTAKGAPSILLSDIGSPSTAFRAAISCTSSGLGSSYLPYGDGIFNRNIPAPNDWSIMAKYMCAGIAYQTEEGTLYGGGGAICISPP